MKTDKLLQLIQQKNTKRSGGALPLPKAQKGVIGGLWDTDRKAFVDSTRMLLCGWNNFNKSK